MQSAFREPPLSLEGAADHWNHREDDDYYSQPGAPFNLMSDALGIPLSEVMT